ncbi:MAG TPA: hypothetical protein VHZ24_13055 [Pirellulales bacterium]|nr:hypothetical protein [Pirellulales bacterium]
MPANFDPYHAWLGIPQGTRPLNHYQLLGLKLFTAEPPVIAEAAQAQLAKLQPHLKGAQGSAAQLVLQEVNAAKNVLLNAAGRQKYDAQLRAQLGMPSPAAPRAPAAAPPRPAASPTARPAAPAVGMAPQAVPVQAAPAQAMPVGGFAQPVAAPLAVAQAAAFPTVGAPQPFGAAAFGAPADGFGGAPMVRKTVARRKRSNPTAAILIVGIILVAASGAGVFYFRNQLSDQFDKLVGAAPQTEPEATAPEGTMVKKRYFTRDGKEATDPHERKYNDVAAPPAGAAPQTESEAMKTVTGGLERAMQDDKPGKSSDGDFMGFRADRNSMGTKPDDSKIPTREIPHFPNTKAEPEETENVKRGLGTVRLALGERNEKKAREQLDLALLDADSGDSLRAVDHTRQLVEAVGQFWHAVRESVKGLEVGSELNIGDTVAIVTEIEGNKLGLRVNGQNKDYFVDKLSPPLARGLAERWLKKDDPSSKVVVAAFLAVDPKSDLKAARELMQQAKSGGAEVDDLIVELDGIKR